MKKFLILLLTLTLILGVFVSCNSNLPIDDETSEVTKQETTESSQTNQTENIETSDTLTETDETSESEGIEYVESYDFVEIDGQHYMVLNSYNFHPDHYCVFETPPPSFDSVEEFLDEWRSGSFDHSTLEYIAEFFSRTENGIPILDPNDFYVPSMPDGWKLGYSDDPILSFKDGQMITFKAECEDESALYVDVLGKELFEKLFNFEKHLLTQIPSDQKVVYMELESLDGDKRPYHYSLYVSESGLYSRYSIYSVEPLTNEQLLSFGLQKYEG